MEKVGQREENWGSFLQSLPPNDYRYCVFDIEYKTNDGMNCSKIFFCNWLAEGTPIKRKMLFATAKEAFKAYLDLNGKEICINSVDDVPALSRSSPRRPSSRSSPSELDRLQSIPSILHPLIQPLIFLIITPLHSARPSIPLPPLLPSHQFKAWL